jgi:predicted site-specific integrase-resolvase
MLTKYNRLMELTAEEVQKLVIELEDRLTTPAINTKEGAVVAKATEVHTVYQAIKDRLSPSGQESIEKSLSDDQEGFIIVDEANAKFISMREDDVVCVISISDFRLVLDNLGDLNEDVRVLVD